MSTPPTQSVPEVKLQRMDSDGDVFYTAPTSASSSLDDDDAHLQPMQRPRVNSEVESVEYDIKVTQLPNQYGPIQQPLIEDHKHNRGTFLLPFRKLPDDEYQKPSAEPGEIFIFNFEQIDEEPTRLGTRIDVRELIDTFGRLKYNVVKQRIFNDLTSDEVRHAIRTAKTNFEAREKPMNCLIVIFLSHGEPGDVILTKDRAMKISEIVGGFQCPQLRGVPQWYTFLACKQGTNEEPSSEKPMEIVSEQTFSQRLPDNVIIYYSTTEGNKSARTRDTGTWLIQELCRNLNGYGRRDELINILTRTNKCVANNYYAKGEFRQSPVIVSTLTKKFYLTTSRERMALLKTIEKLEEFEDHLKPPVPQ